MGSDSGSDKSGGEQTTLQTQQKKDEGFSFFGNLAEDLSSIANGTFTSPHSAYDKRNADAKVRENGLDPNSKKGREMAKAFLRGGEYGPGGKQYNPSDLHRAGKAAARVTRRSDTRTLEGGSERVHSLEAKTVGVDLNARAVEVAEDAEEGVWDASSWLGEDKPRHAVPVKPASQPTSPTAEHSTKTSATSRPTPARATKPSQKTNIDLDGVDTSDPDAYHRAQMKNIAAINAQQEAEEKAQKAEQERQRRAREQEQRANQKQVEKLAAQRRAQEQAEAKAAANTSAIEAYGEHQAAKREAAGATLGERQTAYANTRRSREQDRLGYVKSMMAARKRGKTLSPTAYYAGPGQSDYAGISTRDVVARSLVGEGQHVGGDRDAFSSLGAEAAAANQRLADAAMKTSDFSGLVPGVQDALRTGGRQAQLEVADLVMRMDTRNPKHAVKFLEAVVGPSDPQTKPSPLHKSDLATMDLSPYRQTPQEPGLVDLSQLDIGPDPFAPKSLIGPGVDVAAGPLVAAPAAGLALAALGVLTILGADNASKQLQGALREMLNDLDPFRSQTPPSQLPQQPGVDVETFPQVDPGLLGPTPPSVPSTPEYPSQLENIPPDLDIPDVVDIAKQFPEGPQNHDEGAPLHETTKKGLAGGRNQSDVDAVIGVISSSGASTKGNSKYTEQEVKGGIDSRDSDFDKLRDVLGVDDKGVNEGIGQNGGRYKSFTSKSGDVEVFSYDHSTMSDEPTIKIEVLKMNNKSYTIGRRY